MTKRQAITDKMKLEAVLIRFRIPCAVCREPLVSGSPIEWDHIHALVHGGEHKAGNIRPLHPDCHKPKTKRDIGAKAKGDRILGLTCNGPKKKIPSRPFAKKVAGNVRREVFKP